MKVVKIILGVIAVIVLFVITLIAALPLWLGPVVKPAANSLVPKFTKTDFHLGILGLNPYTGKFELGDLQLSNPSGYEEQYAATVGRIFVDVAMNTIGDKYIHIEEIEIKDVFVSYVSANGVNNFKQIQYNLAGGKEAYEAKQAEAEIVKQESTAKEEVQKAEVEKSEEQLEREEAEKQLAELNKKKVVIDKLTISGLKVKLGFLPITLPTITLTDIGKESEGVNFKELCDQILAAVMKSMGAISDGAKAFAGALGDGVSAAGEGASKALNSVGESAGKALDNVSEGASKAVDTFKGLFK